MLQTQRRGGGSIIYAGRAAEGIYYDSRSYARQQRFLYE